MRELTSGEIDKLASGKDVKRTAVVNVLSGLKYEVSEYAARANFEQNARMYKWNGATKAAIRKGINKAFRG